MKLKHSDKMVLGMAGFYAVLVLLGVFLAHVSGDPETQAFNPFSLPGTRPLSGAAASVAAVALVHWALRVGHRRYAFVRHSSRDVQMILGGLTGPAVLILALMSALGEEWIFRGWLLNEIGLLFSSVLFGAAHVPMNRNWVYWPLFAFLVGCFLGALCIWTSSLLWAVIVHAAINYLNISWILAVRDRTTGTESPNFGSEL